jgi:hypothetical protein
VDRKQRRSSCTQGALQLYRDASAGQVPGTKVAAGGKMGPASTSSQVDRRQVHLDFGPDSNRRYLLSDIRPCLSIRPFPNSIACVQTSYKTMVIYSRFYGSFIQHLHVSRWVETCVSTSHSRWSLEFLHAL